MAAKRRRSGRKRNRQDAPATLAALARVLNADAPPIAEVPFALQPETPEVPTAAPVALPFTNDTPNGDKEGS
jgi:hypothetical protein